MLNVPRIKMSFTVSVTDYDIVIHLDITQIGKTGEYYQSSICGISAASISDRGACGCVRFHMFW